MVKPSLNSCVKNGFLLSSPVKLSIFPTFKIQHGNSGKIKNLNSVRPSGFK